MSQQPRRGAELAGVRARIVRSIFLKEVRETLRDRRTLFLLIAMPMIFYPLLMVLIVEVAASQTSQIKATVGKVAVTGGALPDGARDALLEGEELELVEVPDARAALDDGTVHVVLELPDDFNQQLTGGASAPLVARYDSVVPLSSETLDRVKERLRGWQDKVLGERLARKGLARAYIEPLAFTQEDAAPAERRLGSVASQFLPVLVLIFMVTGAFYPAIDLTAGEKERKTIQTLLTSPVRPMEVVAGKYLTVLCVTLISGLINLLSILLIIGHNVMVAGGKAGGLDLGLGQVRVADMVALGVVVFLLGLLISALLLTIATFASSPKEAQNYLSPVYMLCLVPVFIAQIPGVEVGQGTAFIPLLNLALVMKEVLVEGVVWEHLFLVIVSSGLVTVLVLALAARLYTREELIIGGSGARGLLALARDARVEPGAAPEPGGALAFVALLLVLLYYVGSAIQAWSLLPGLLITLVGLLLVPTVAMTLWRGHRPREVFHLRRPPALAMVGALLLGLTSFIWVGAATELFHESFLPVPDEFLKLMEDSFKLPQDPAGKLGVILVVALAPAICEEAVFRGWLLSSFRGRAPGWLAIGVTAVFFGVFHLSIYRLLGTTTLGLLMGYLVWHTRSIWPAVLFHFLNNACSLLSADLLPSLGIDVESQHVPVWLVLASLTLGALGLALVHISRRDEPPPPISDDPDAALRAA